MTKVNASTAKPPVEIYSVIVDGQPIPVQASSAEEAAEKAQAQVSGETKEVGDGS